MTSSPSAPVLKQLVEEAVMAALGGLPPGLVFVIDEVVVDDVTPLRLNIQSTLHFYDKGSPYCCGEPDCHLGIRSVARNRLIVEALRGSSIQEGNLEKIDFDEIEVVYHAGVRFDRY